MVPGQKSAPSVPFIHHFTIPASVGNAIDATGMSRDPPLL